MSKNFQNIAHLVQEEIIKLITTNQLGKASELLSEWAVVSDENDIMDAIIILRRGIAEIENEYLYGKIDFKSASEIKNQLSDRLLRLTKTIMYKNNGS